MDALSTVDTAALSEGVKFLFQQATELLSAWRARRRDRAAQPPRVLDRPEDVTMAGARPLAGPVDEESEALLDELTALAEPIQDGRIDVGSPAARAAVERLREVVEAALQTPIRFAGEPPRPVTISDIHVVAERVAGDLSGLRANLAKLPGGTRISGVNVQAGQVEGSVTGVELI